NGHFVQEALEEEGQCVRAGCAHGAGRNGVLVQGLHQAHVGHYIHREDVVAHVGAGHRRPTVGGRGDEVILPGDQLAGSIQTSLQVVETTGTEVVVHHVVFTGPLQFHRTTFHATGDGRGFVNEVVGQLAAEATPDAGHVQDRIFRRHTGNDGSTTFATLRDLGRSPDFNAAVFVQRGGRFRLQLRVADIGVFVVGADNLGGTLQGGNGVTLAGRTLGRTIGTEGIDHQLGAFGTGCCSAGGEIIPGSRFGIGGIPLYFEFALGLDRRPGGGGHDGYA